jgi:hypothetical protein
MPEICISFQKCAILTHKKALASHLNRENS